MTVVRDRSVDVLSLQYVPKDPGKEKEIRFASHAGVRPRNYVSHDAYSNADLSMH